jgi:hypothetical protein
MPLTSARERWIGQPRVLREGAEPCTRGGCALSMNRLTYRWEGPHATGRAALRRGHLRTLRTRGSASLPGSRSQSVLEKSSGLSMNHGRRRRKESLIRRGKYLRLLTSSPTPNGSWSQGVPEFSGLEAPHEPPLWGGDGSSPVRWFMAPWAVQKGTGRSPYKEIPIVGVDSKLRSSPRNGIGNAPSRKNVT